MWRGVVCFASLALVSGKIYFSESFDDGWQNRWVISQWKAKEGTAGTWAPSDRGIMTTEDSKFYGISAAFDSFSNEGKDLIIQYQVELMTKELQCSGAYVKIGPTMKDQKQFSESTPYNIMFGPDICGPKDVNSRTHLIFNYKGKNVLKTKEIPFEQETVGIPHMYRLTLKPDNTARFEIDEKTVYEGSITDDWELLMPKSVVDPTDKKPKDWVDDARIDDPKDKKPANWVPEAMKRIPDPAAKKPDSWDDDEDGDWVRPLVSNPEYKGEWSAKTIPNPAFKGVWQAKRIENPEYVEDDAVYKYDDFGYIGIDVWQITSGTAFDGFIVCDDIEEADAMAAKWRPLYKDASKKARRYTEDQDVNMYGVPESSGIPDAWKTDDEL